MYALSISLLSSASFVGTVDTSDMFFSYHLLRFGPNIDSLILKSYVHCLTLQVAACLFAVHMMRKLKTGDFGSLSVSLVEKITILSQKVSLLLDWLSYCILQYL